MGDDAISSLGCTPVLLNKVELAVILWVKVAQMAAPLDELLELWSLVCEIGLRKEDTPTAAVHAARGALEIVALSRQARFRPQPPFDKNSLHALEPAGHGRVIVWKIKGLYFSGR